MMHIKIGDGRTRKRPTDYKSPSVVDVWVPDPSVSLQRPLTWEGRKSGPRVSGRGKVPS